MATNRARFTAEIHVVKVGTQYIGLAEIGGQRLRGNPAPDRLDAARQLFLVLASPSNPEASIAIDMALEGQTIADLYSIEATVAGEQSDGD